MARREMGTSSEDAEAIVLVDENDREIGYAAKLPPHESGALHRAFSVFVFDAAGRMLLQQRAAGKYHFAGLWTNACCSHPRRGEPTEAAALRRLKLEIGIEPPLEPLFSFIYRATDPVSGLTEYELDHVFVARFDGALAPEPTEVSGTRWVWPAELRREVQDHPERFTPWFKIVLDRLLADARVAAMIAESGGGGAVRR